MSDTQSGNQFGNPTTGLPTNEPSVVKSVTFQLNGSTPNLKRGKIINQTQIPTPPKETVVTFQSSTPLNGNKTDFHSPEPTMQGNSEGISQSTINIQGIRSTRELPLFIQETMQIEPTIYLIFQHRLWLTFYYKFLELITSYQHGHSNVKSVLRFISPPVFRKYVLNFGKFSPETRQEFRMILEHKIIPESINISQRKIHTTILDCFPVVPNGVKDIAITDLYKIWNEADGFIKYLHEIYFLVIDTPFQEAIHKTYHLIIASPNFVERLPEKLYAIIYLIETKEIDLNSKEFKGYLSQVDLLEWYEFAQNSAIQPVYAEVVSKLVQHSLYGTKTGQYTNKTAIHLSNSIQFLITCIADCSIITSEKRSPQPAMSRIKFNKEQFDKQQHKFLIKKTSN